MAKRGKRITINLECTICKRQNYVTEKNKVNTQDRLLLKKFCRQCKKVTEHKEVKYDVKRYFILDVRTDLETRTGDWGAYEIDRKGDFRTWGSYRNVAFDYRTEPGNHSLSLDIETTKIHISHTPIVSTNSATVNDDPVSLGSVSLYEPLKPQDGVKDNERELRRIFLEYMDLLNIQDVKKRAKYVTDVVVPARVGDGLEAFVEAAKPSE